jgi:hypothetical protein
MAKIKTKIELSEKDLLDLITEKYNIKRENAQINVSEYDGDLREPSWVAIIVEGESAIEKENER